MRIFLFFICLFVYSLNGYTQIDTRPVVGVARFACDEVDTYAGLVTEKVVEMLTNTKRFQVVDRTSYEKVHQELEFQKTEAFIDSKSTVEQGVAVAAEKMITGHITKIPVYAIRNQNGSVKGYKASVAFQMKVVDVSSGLSTEATSFEGKASNLMLSPESAVTQAMASLQFELDEYFRKNFPVSAKILKLLEVKKDVAAIVLINAGKEQGLKVGDKLTVERIEMLEGKPYPTKISELEVVKLSGDSFSECKVQKKTAVILTDSFNAAEVLNCLLIIN